MLSIEDLQVAYNGLQVLWGVSLEVKEREIICLIGSNGSGKSTTLNAVSGQIRPMSGRITFAGQRIDGMRPDQIVNLGLCHVLERRRVFNQMTVLENLRLGAYCKRADPHWKESMEWVLELFPILAERQSQIAGTMSGGQQQMLAMARGLMAQPKLLMLDEPFIGLTPQMVGSIVELIQTIRDTGVTVLFIEQNVEQALTISDRAYLLESGRLVKTGSGKEVLASRELREVILGL